MSRRWLVIDRGSRRMENQLVLIEGHCDDHGTNEYNLALGERRAKATMNFLGPSVPSVTRPAGWRTATHTSSRSADTTAASTDR